MVCNTDYKSNLTLLGLRGTNSGLEKALDEVFSRTVNMEGGNHPVIPQGVDLTKFFDDYIKSMAQTKD